MFNLELALRPFKDTRILAKAGIVFGLYAITSLLQFVLNMAVSMSELIPVPVDNDSLSLFTSVISVLGSLVISILLFPVTLYLSGYTYSIADRIRINSTEALPDHIDIMERIKLGTIAISFNFILTAPFIVLMILVFMLLAIASGQDITSVFNFSLNPGIIAGFVAMIFFFGMYLFVVNTFMVPVFMYRYLSTHSFTQALRIDAFFEVLRVSWLDWIIVFLFTIMVGFVSMGIMLVLCCIGPFVSPLISTVSLLVTAGLTGAVYHKIERENVIHSGVLRESDAAGPTEEIYTTSPDTTSPAGPTSHVSGTIPGNASDMNATDKPYETPSGSNSVG
jgi:hypothetical protein